MPLFGCFKVQDILFINEREFVSSGDVVSKDSAQYAIQVWDLRSTACVSNQIFHVNANANLNRILSYTSSK